MLYGATSPNPLLNESAASQYFYCSLFKGQQQKLFKKNLNDTKKAFPPVPVLLEENEVLKALFAFPVMFSLMLLQEVLVGKIKLQVAR